MNRRSKGIPCVPRPATARGPPPSLATKPADMRRRSIIMLGISVFVFSKCQAGRTVADVKSPSVTGRVLTFNVAAVAAKRSIYAE